MKYAVNSREIKEIDEYSIKVVKIPEVVLMERAAYEVVAVMKRKLVKTDRIIVVCGQGNNGGDGVAAGRILFLQGYHVAILFIGEEEKASVGMKMQLEIAKNLGIKFDNCNKLCEYNIIIDAIFGVGLSRSVTSPYEEVINEINKLDCRVYSVDIPSGISADTGKIMNVAVKADNTITFGFQKQGLLFYPGADYGGEITVADIGFPEAARIEADPNTFYYEKEDIKRLPYRDNYSNKGSYGKVLIIAGSKGMSGAAYLSAKAAYRTGAGLVKVLTSNENRLILQTSLPEALFGAYDGEKIAREEFQSKIITELSWASVIVIGPGLGQSDTANILLETVLKHGKVPIIVDADAITLLSKLLDNKLSKENENKTQTDQNLAIPFTEIGYERIHKRVECLKELTKVQMIVTPHLLELSRLIQIPISDIVNNLVDTANQCSYNNNLIYAIKDARTLVTQSAKRYINVSGNNGMATGGSGDILTGIIGALIAQGMEPYEATCLAVYIHGLSGDYAALRCGKYSMMAGDIIDSIEEVLLSEIF